LCAISSALLVSFLFLFPSFFFTPQFTPLNPSFFNLSPLVPKTCCFFWRKKELDGLGFCAIQLLSDICMGGMSIMLAGLWWGFIHGAHAYFEGLAGL